MKSKSHMIHKAAVKRIAKRPTKETMGKPSKPSKCCAELVGWQGPRGG
jgi:histone H3/H4